MDVEPHSNDVRERKMTLKLHSRTPSLLQDSTSLPATAEFGFKGLKVGILVARVSTALEAAGAQTTGSIKR